MGRLWNAWERYWFRPAPLFDLAVVRFFAVGYQLLWMMFTDYYPTLLMRAGSPDFLYRPLPIVRLFTLPFGADYRPSPEVFSALYAITVLMGVLAFIGLKTNLCLLVFAAGNIFLQGFIYSFGEFHHPEAILIIALFLLAFSPSGSVLSLDDWLKRQTQSLERQQFESLAVAQETSVFARWPILVIRWLLVLVYLSASISKLIGGGALTDWMNGYTLQYHLLHDGLRWNRELGVWLSQSNGLAVLLSWMTILFEGTFVLLALFPVLAWIYLPVGIVFHTGIFVIHNAPFFSFIILYSVFVPWSKAADRLSSRTSQPKPEIFYDGQCPLCIRALTGISYFDWANRMTYSDLETHWQRLHQLHPEITMDDCRREMHLLTPDQKVYRGYFAFRQIWKQLPIYWPLAALTELPFASAVGPRLYRWVAARRPRFHTACDTGMCLMHSPVNK